MPLHVKYIYVNFYLFLSVGIGEIEGFLQWNSKSMSVHGERISKKK
jgi:hypothetical protein